jgi:hypothetical protein
MITSRPATAKWMAALKPPIPAPMMMMVELCMVSYRYFLLYD